MPIKLFQNPFGTAEFMDEDVDKHQRLQRGALSRRLLGSMWMAAFSVLAACSVSDTLRPTVDIGMQTASTHYTSTTDLGAPVPLPPAPVGNQSYPGNSGPMALAAAPAMSDPYAQGSDGPTPPASIASVAPATVAPVAVAPAAAIPATVSAPPQEQPSAIPPMVEAPPAAARPVQVASAAGSQLPVSLPQPDARPVVQASAANSGRGMQALVPSNPMLAAAPRPDSPMSRSQSSRMPADEVSCRRELKRLGVRYTDLAPIREGSCGIDWPVKVSGLSGNIQMKPAATLSCDMALAFAEWTKNELAPAARWRYMTGVKTIHQGSSYSCRRISGTRTLSEHGKGNALDVMRIELKNGRDIDVRRPGLFAFRQRGLLNNVRSDACSYFTTVLGPGYNADHADHFHFDIKERRSGRRACR